ncbi:MAG: histidine kinase N-terminal 7TM domain-containing protein [Haloferacaceae archaeon]
MEAGLGVVRAVYAFALGAGIVLGVVVWRNRENTGAYPLLGSIVGGLLWSGALFFATLTSDPALSMWLERSVYIGVVIAVASIFLFGLEYTGRGHLVTPPLLAALAVEPMLAVGLALFAPEPIFFESLTPDPTAATGVAVEWGVGFWLHSIYSYALLTVTVVLIVRMFFRTRSLYRGQILALVLAVVSPSAGNLLWIVGPVSFDSTPLGFVAANAFFTLAITRYRFIELTPIAQDRVIDTIGDAVFVVDADDRVVEVNPAAREIAATYLADDRLVGRSADDLLDALPEAEGLYRETMRGETEQRAELSVGDSHYEVTATPIADDGDRIHGWLFLVSDVTERVRRERALRRRNEQLDQFASVVSHDLRNPISIAEGYADLARETGDLSHLEQVTDALERMDAIVDDVLELARNDDDAIDVATVDLGSVAERAWETVDTGDASLRVTESARIRADGDRLSRLLENLFRNAVEHGSTSPRSQAHENAVEHGHEPDPDSPLQVEVGLVDSGRTAGFYVADDGPGIPADVRDRVFEMGVTTSDEGTGFGLNIVEAIAEAHGWSVRATESASGGARIEVTGVAFADGSDPTDADPNAADADSNGAETESDPTDHESTDVSRRGRHEPV